MRRSRCVPLPVRSALAGSALLLTAVLAAALPARADERKGSFEFGFYGGNTFYAKEQQLSNEIEKGLRIGWNFKPSFEVELEYTHTNTAQLQSGASTLISAPFIFTSVKPTPEFTSDSYTARLLINPRNERRRLKPYMAIGMGGIVYTSSPSLSSSQAGYQKDLVFTIGGGIRQRLTAHMAFRAEFETAYAPKDIYHNEHVNIGLTWVFGGGKPADSDGDGVLDINDRCPDTPKGALVDKHDGCPWDLDGDGVMEGLDKCPDTPRGWPVDESGCPLDSDGDGVPDGADKCADTPKGAIVDANGCPMDSDGDSILDGIDKCPDTPKGAIVDPPDSPTAGCPHDSDGDGVPDGVDQCPGTPAGAAVDAEGCPHDSDGDRVLDGIDQCPDTPKGQKVDREGCPRVRLDKPEPQILQNVRFLEKAELYPGADAWLALALDALNYWPDVTVEVGVYTDNSGKPQANKMLAQRRAEVIKKWLVDHGIEARRIIAKGYGAVNFIADNSTDEGKEKNRRVELKRLSGDLRKHPKPEAETPPEKAAPEAKPTAEPAAPAPVPPATPTPTPAPAPTPGSTPAPAAPSAPAPAPSPTAPPAPPKPAPTTEPTPTPTPAPTTH
ncbi:MAG TPA: thrombospondin type 3 repeat-containing protein [Candidatus Polarisedimenticolia bacterium]|nr:thrombospondin type 3 repeat-containing protein [Candidatus Polarisedimenticolia bacterium]